MKKKIGHIIKDTIRRCHEKGLLKRCPLPDYLIEIPNNPDHGHFATNLPLTLASSQKKRPVEIASVIIDNLDDNEAILEKVETAGPGFINFFIKTGEWQKFLADIIRQGERYGARDSGSGEKVLMEFVSANPTGPLHLGHGRGAALGDTICRILSFCGYNVVREFYINDSGQQVRLLGESIFSRWKQITDPGYPFPENGYHGDYINDLALKISEDVDLLTLETDRAIKTCMELGKNMMLDEIKRDLELFRVHFDVWYNESDLFSTGLVEKALNKMMARGEIYEKDGAQWIRTSAFGDDKDRVIRKNDGQYTYFTSDIAYHLEKWKRGFTKAVNIWGADHHGYVQRVRSALRASGIDDAWFSVLLIQLVKLWKEGQEIKMSKRTGQYVTLKELLDEVDVDAARFIFLTKAHDSPLDFDIDLVKKHDSENPVYYVQYAHARICSVFRKAESEGIPLPLDPDKAVHRLVLDEEMDLIRLLEEFPSLLEDICLSFEAHRLTYYLTELAAQFHRYFNLGTKLPENRIITSDRDLSQARLVLAEGIKRVINTGLNLLGVNAPERM
ncbi:MAG TPA: arginine--tRNA ligase [Desulfatiglandales bacterium]|nr:arginine--tRNA ligase [Desulfatiglandales bacterium]